MWGSWAAVGLGRGLGLCEELVHDFGTGGDDGPEFAAVDDFGGAGGGVPDEAGDLLDADAAVAHQADEGGPELARCPAVADVWVPRTSSTSCDQAILVD